MTTPDTLSEALTALEIAEARIEELELQGEAVSEEFEKDCWKAMRRILNACNFPWNDFDPGDGVTADDACEHVLETLKDSVTALDAAHATIAGLREAAAVPLRDLLTDMGRTADDPMWADHVELPKATLRRWIATVRAALNGVKSP